VIGHVLDGRYRVGRQLGEGGMGAVYEATHVGTGRRVAVNVILDGDLARSAEALGRFQREARAAGAIETPHISSTSRRTRRGRARRRAATITTLATSAAPSASRSGAPPG
jgi:serine/threonine protein kinase